MATYPGALPNLTESIPGTPDTTALGTEVAGRDHAGHHTQLAEELGAVIATLGINPQGDFETVSERLDALAGGVFIDRYEGAGTYEWSKRPGLVYVHEIIISPGGGGGSGGVRTTGSVSGGASGAPGRKIERRIMAAQLGATEEIVIGATGQGGAGLVSPGTGLFNGNDGSTGGNVVVPGLTVEGGIGGQGGRSANPAAGAAVANSCSDGSQWFSNGAAATSGFGNGSTPAALSRVLPTGGGGGGGLSDAVSGNGASAGAYTTNPLGLPTAGASGGAGGASPEVGSDGSAVGDVGMGGGGGGANNAAGSTGRRGGDAGGYGAGGGGGGAGRDSTERGGHGSRGLVIRVSYCVPLP